MIIKFLLEWCNPLLRLPLSLETTCEFCFVLHYSVFFCFFCGSTCVFMSAEARIPALMTWVNWIKPFSFTLMDKQTPPLFKTKDVSFIVNSFSHAHTHGNFFLCFFLASNLLQIQKRDFFPLTFRSFVRFSLLGHTKSMFGLFLSAAASYFLWPNPCREGRGRRWSRYSHF